MQPKVLQKVLLVPLTTNRTYKTQWVVLGPTVPGPTLKLNLPMFNFSCLNHSSLFLSHHVRSAPTRGVQVPNLKRNMYNSNQLIEESEFVLQVFQPAREYTAFQRAACSITRDPYNWYHSICLICAFDMSHLGLSNGMTLPTVISPRFSSVAIVASSKTEQKSSSSVCSYWVSKQTHRMVYLEFARHLIWDLEFFKRVARRWGIGGVRFLEIILAPFQVVWMFSHISAPNGYPIWGGEWVCHVLHHSPLFDVW